MIARSEDTGSKPNAKAQRQNHRALGPPQRHLGKRPGRGAEAARSCPETRVRAAPGTNAKGLDVRVAPGTNAKVT
ncbi:hypothetical protein MBLNU230_g8118t1 [Neophaeotheca triangularis]